MGRYPTSRCPNCGAMAHMCQCGTMQQPSQLPQRIQRQMYGYQPRGYFRQGPQPPFQQPQMPYPQPQQPYQQAPQMAPPPPQMDINQIMNMPAVQERINAIVEQALSTAPPPPMAGSIPEQALYQLANLSIEEVPGEPPKSNSGGRLNAYKRGRQEVVDFVKSAARGILEGPGDAQEPVGGEFAAQVGAQGYDAPAPNVPGVLQQGGQAGG